MCSGQWSCLIVSVQTTFSLFEIVLAIQSLSYPGTQYHVGEGSTRKQTEVFKVAGAQCAQHEEALPHFQLA